MKVKIAILLIMLLTSILNLAAYQNSSLNLMTPSALGDLEGELALSHRFFGAVDKDVENTFFGMNSGANIGVFYRNHLKYGLEAKLGVIREKKEYQIGLAYRPTPDDFFLQAQTDLQYFSFNEPSQSGRRKNCMLLVSFQNKNSANLPFLDKTLADVPVLGYLDRITLNGNVGYDGYYQRVFMGAGLTGRITEKLHLIGEYYPVIDRTSASYEVRPYFGDYDAYCAGIKLDTYAHQFMFTFGNAEAMDVRHLSMGTNNNKDIKFGFNVQRKF